MSRIEEMINALRKCAKEHEDEVVYTGQIVTFSLCRDVADYLEADKWHYPSKGEYPTNDEEVLCCLKRPDGFVKNWYETGYYNGQKWSCNVDEDFLSDLIISGYKLEVIAWQYIVPPKEEA